MIEFLRHIQLSVMLFLSGSCGVLIILAFSTKTLTPKRRQALVSLETEAMLLLLADRLAYAYRGDVSTKGWWIVRISNFLVYLLSLFVAHAFNLYLMDLYKNEGKQHIIPKRLVACEIIFLLGIVTLIIAQFTGFYYTFDENNYYVRSGGIAISYLFPFAIAVLQFTVIYQYRHLLEKKVVTPLILFLILPYVATAFQFFFYGLSLTNITMVGMCVLLYLFEINKLNMMQEAKLAAERANSAKSRFLANVSHEIRTPINTIMGMDDMLIREDPTGVPKAYYMSIMNYAFDIMTASETLLGFINDILDISKIESGKMHLVEMEYSTRDQFRSIVSMIKVKSDQKDLSFDMDIDENIPQKLYGDMAKIKQVALNLLTNAVKYTEKGGLKFTVKVESRDDDTCKLLFSVKDTGIGVKPEDMDKLFTAFERFDEARNNSILGTGLGLDISRQFVELMGGRIWCESVYGQGSIFSFEVEQKIVDEEPMGKFDLSVLNEHKGPFRPSFKAPEASVLMIDDNPMNHTVIKAVLKETEMRIDSSMSGQEGLKKLKDNHYDLVLLDHLMPQMDGLEVIRHIREDFPSMPVIALTADYSADSKAFFESHGFDGYLSKPVNNQLLDKAIMGLLPEELVTPNTVITSGEDEELADEFKWLYEVEGIDVSEGIKNSGGAQPYIFALLLFLDTIDDNARVIDDAYLDYDIALFTIKVHALKTSARIIGAMKLMELCQNIEQAGKKGDPHYVIDHYEEMIEMYKGFKEKLSRLSYLSGDIGDKREFISQEELIKAYGRLRDYANDMDYDSAEELINGMKKYELEENDAITVKEAEKALRSLDWDKMIEILDKK